MALVMAGLYGCRGPRRSEVAADATVPYDEVSVVVARDRRAVSTQTRTDDACVAVKAKVTYAAAADGEILPTEDAKLLEVKVDQPDDVRTIGGAEERTRMGTASQARRVGRAEASGGLTVAQASVRLEMAAATGRLAVQGASTVVALSDLHQRVTVETQARTLRRSDVEGDMVVPSKAQTIARSDVSQATELVKQQMALDKAVTLFAAQRVGLGAEQRMKVLAHLGSLSGLTDLGDLTMLDDTVILEMLVELGVKPGIWDEASQPVLSADAVVISKEELSKLIADMRNDGTVKKHAGGQTALLFEPRETGMADLSLKAMGRQRQQRYYHGGSLIVALQVRNSGAVPLNQLYCFLPLPQHTHFNRFLQEDFSGRVYAYLPDARLLFWKLYCALEPGHTFISVFVLDLEEWKL